MPLVIIADDDLLVMDIVRNALEARGHIVGCLDDGKPVKTVVEMKRPHAKIQARHDDSFAELDSGVRMASHAR